MPSASSAAGEPRQLRLAGKAGSLVLNLEEMDPTGLVAFQFVKVPQDGAGAGAAAAGGRSMLLLASHNKTLVAEVTAQVLSHVRGVSQGYLVGLVVKVRWTGQCL